MCCYVFSNSGKCFIVLEQATGVDINTAAIC